MVLCFALGGYERNTFIKMCFSNKKFYLIRLCENLLIGLPFIILLVANGLWLAASAIPIVNSVLVLVNNKNTLNYVVPTPFYNYPFEFLVGVRKSFILVLLMYLICGIAIAVGNFNLGLFSLIITHLTCVFFYFDLEHYFFIWVHSMKSTDFIIKKIKIILLYSTMITLPILVGLSFFFTDRLLVILLVQIMGYISISASLLSKYAFYPNRISFPVLIMFMVSLILIPLVVVFIPYFYLKSQQELKKILK